MWSNAVAFALLLGFLQSIVAQNADLSNEATSGDLLLLRALIGEKAIGSASVLPPRLDELMGTPTALDTFRRYIAVYYAPIGDTVRLPWQFFPRQSGRFALGALQDRVLAVRIDGSVYARTGLTTSHTTEGLAAGRLSLRAIGLFDTHWSFLLDLANGALVRGTPERAAVTDPDMARSPRLFLDQRTFYDRAIGAVQYQGALGRIRLGRDVVGWGYSPLGGMLLSIASPLMDHLLVDIGYGALRFSYVHGLVSDTDTTGVSIPTKFIAAHRLQLDVTENLSFAISDAVVYSGRGIDLGYLNPLGFYVSSGLLTQERNQRDNSLLAFEAAWRPRPGTMLYGTLLADDVSFSTLADTSARGNNNKYAWQLGIAQYIALGMRHLLLCGQYMRINPFVYSHRTLTNSWTNSGEVIGVLQQPNSDCWTLQATLWLAPRLRLQVRGDYQRWGENWLDSTGRIVTVIFPTSRARIPIGNVGGDALRGDGDVLPEPFAVGNRFLRGNVSHTRRLSVQLQLEPLLNVFVEARAEYMLRTGGNMPLRQLWWWIQLRLGY